MFSLTGTSPAYPDLSGPDFDAGYSWALPEPWSSLLIIAVGLFLIVARRPIARLFAAMLAWVGLHAEARFHRFASVFLVASGIVWTVLGAVNAALVAVAVMPT
jgi:hypothetical protein